MLTRPHSLLRIVCVFLSFQWPIVPVGHTAYTFFGVDADHPNGVIPASAASPSSTKPAAAPSTAAAPAPKPAGEKKEKAAKPAAAPKAPKSAAKAPEPDQPEYTKLDIRVGQIVKAGRHPKPEVTSLYVEEIDVGEDQPRQIVSGLVKVSSNTARTRECMSAPITDLR